MKKGPVSEYIQYHYRHFNAAALMDAAKGYETHLLEGGKMMVTLAGAMSTAELGLSFAEMIRQDKVAIISCTGANLEEDIMNLVAHSHYKRVPNYRDLSPQDEWDLLENHYNRVTDTCIPEEEAFRRLQKHIQAIWKVADQNGERYFPHEYMYKMLLSGVLEQYYEIDPRLGEIMPFGPLLATFYVNFYLNRQICCFVYFNLFQIKKLFWFSTQRFSFGDLC